MHPTEHRHQGGTPACYAEHMSGVANLKKHSGFFMRDEKNSSHCLLQVLIKHSCTEISVQLQEKNDLHTSKPKGDNE
jgi:hypothetical protein